MGLSSVFLTISTVIVSKVCIFCLLMQIKQNPMDHLIIFFLQVVKRGGGVFLFSLFPKNIELCQSTPELTYIDTEET